MHGSFYIPGWSGSSKSLNKDATCSQCGYALAGLRNASRCPECGAPLRIETKSVVTGGTMTQAPMHYLRIFVAGCWSLLIGALLFFIAAPLTAWFLRYPQTTIALCTVGVVFWTLGVFIITRPRQLGQQANINTTLEWRAIRHLARWSHIALAVGIILAYTAQIMHNSAMIAFMKTPAYLAAPIGAVPFPPRTALNWFLLGTGGVISAFGTLGPVMLGLYMARLADWAQDMDLGTRLRVATWGLVIGPVLAFIFLALLPLTKFPPLIFMGIWLGWIGVICFIISVVMFAWNTLLFVNMGRWAITNAETFADAQLAIIEKKAQLYHSMPVPTAATSPDSDLPLPTLSAAPDPAPKRPLGKHVIRPRDNVEPLSLADDPPIKRHERGH